MEHVIDDVHLCIIIAAVVLSGALCGLAAYRFAKARQTQRWREARGHVVESDVEVRETVGLGKEKEKTVDNFPRVIYEYTVNGRRHEGQRIALTAESANGRVEEILARYPRGAEITVYYDPDDPEAALLDRGLPHDFSRALTWALVFIPVLAAAAYFGSSALVGVMNRHGQSEDDALPVMIFGVLGLGILAAGAAAQWKAFKERFWPVVTGRVLSSEVERYETSVSMAGQGRSSGSSLVVYRPAVLYEYEVRERRYRSNRIASQPQARVAVPDIAARTVQRYVAGSAVAIRYKPKNPAESVLEARVPAFWHILILGSGLMAVAVHFYLNRT